MADHDGGSVGIDIQPKINPGRFGQEIVAKLTEPVDKAGRKLGRSLADGMQAGFPAGTISKAIREAGATALPAATAAGRSAGERYGQQMRQAIQAELARIGDVSIRVDLDNGSLEQVKAQLAAIGPVDVAVNVNAAGLAGLRAELAGMDAVVKVRVELDRSSLNAARAELALLGATGINLRVNAETARALAQLAALRAAANGLFGSGINVNMNAGGAQSALRGLGLQMAALMAVPLGPVLAAGMGGFIAAISAAGIGMAGLLAVAIPAVTRIRDALAAQKTAQDQVTTATHGTTTAVNAGAIAAAQAQMQSMQLKQAHQQLALAQLSAKDAQQGLNEARKDAVRLMRDMHTQLIGLQLGLRGDALAIERAKLALDGLNDSRQDALNAQQANLNLQQAQQRLNEILNDPASTLQQKEQARLAYEQAREAVKSAEQQLKVNELARKEAQLAYEQAKFQYQQRKEQLAQARIDEAKARKDGIEGSKVVKQAQEQLAAALRGVADAQASIVQMQLQNKVSALQAAQAAGGYAGATDGVTAAQLRLEKAMGKLSTGERELLKDWEAFRKTYRSWVKDLEPDVLPALSGGLDLVASSLHLLDPAITGSAKSLVGLEEKAKSALAGPFWTDFMDDIGVAAPRAITGLGTIAGNVFGGFAGVIQAFLPYLDSFLGTAENLTQEFENWGQSLNGSSEFRDFIDYVKVAGPRIGETLVTVAGALIDVGQALAPLAALQLGFIQVLAEGISWIAENEPGLVRAAAAIWLVNKALVALRATSVIGALSSIGATLFGIGAGATAAAAGLGVVGAVIVGGIGLGKLQQWVTGLDTDVRDVASALVELGQSGKQASGLMDLFTPSLTSGRDALGQFGAEAKEFVDADPLQKVAHGFSELNNLIPGLDSRMDTLGEKFKKVDTALTGMVQQGASDTAAASFKRLAEAAVKAGLSTEQINEMFPKYADAIGSAEFQNQKYNATLDKQIEKIKEQNRQLGLAAQSFATQEQQLISFDTALDRVNESLKTNGTAWNNSTAAGKANKESVLAAASVIQSYSDYLVTNNLVTDENVKKLNAQKEQLVQTATKFFGTEEKARAYVEQLVKTDVQVDGTNKLLGNQQQVLANVEQKFAGSKNAADAYSKILGGIGPQLSTTTSSLGKQGSAVDTVWDNLVGGTDAAGRYGRQIGLIPKNAKTDITVGAKGSFSMTGDPEMQKLLGIVKGLGPQFQIPAGNAGGGYISGSGGPRADDQVTRISAGEMVINAPTVARHLPLLAALNNQGNEGTIYKGRGYAGGGLHGRVLPGLAAGGFLAQNRWSDKYNFGGGDVSAVLKRAKLELGKGVGGMLGYAIGQAGLETAAMSKALSVGLKQYNGSSNKAVQFAIDQLGEPYLWGGTGPDAWDCSGLTQAAWRAAGVNIPRVTYTQISAGTPTSRDKAVPGDLLFPHPGHVMMVANPNGGDRALIHAPHTGDVVRYAPWRTPWIMRHIGGYSSGTDDARKGLSWVGEQGPELVDFRGGERVFPHAESIRLAEAILSAPVRAGDGASSGGGSAYHAHFDGASSRSLQTQVRAAFTAMEIASGERERVGRRN